MRHQKTRSRFRVRAVAAAVTAVGLLAVAGCSQDAVDAAPPSPRDKGVARVCQALHNSLPGELDGLSRRDTHPDSRLTAAWGNEPVVLRCGGGLPAALVPGTRHYRPKTPALAVNGVRWLPEKSHAGVRFTTVDREANVELWVPSHYRPGYTDALVDLASVVKKTVPSRL